MFGAIHRFAYKWVTRLAAYQPPRGIGTAAAMLLILTSTGYGVVRGGHFAAFVNYLKDGQNLVANAGGFRISTIAIAGQKQLSREQILAAAGVTGRDSLIFFDAAAARAKLKTDPWIAEATVQKLYPDRLQITVREREAYAIWQSQGRMVVIAADSTVLRPYVSSSSFGGLPRVIGPGAETRAKSFLDLLDRYPAIRDSVYASIFVAERRWNLKLKNGIDVRLPETNVERALETVVALDRDKKLLSRDITVVDLRIFDRVTLQLSDEAAQARENALKEKTARKKGGAA
jgi:cell division protein FtsQ